jgi:hypothetical protein
MFAATNNRIKLMNNANMQNQEVDFEFQEGDLRHDNNPSMRAITDEHVDGLDTPRQRDEDLYHEVVDNEALVETEPAKKNFFAKYGLYMGVGVIAVVLLGGLGWFAVKVLSPAPIHAQRSSAPENFGTQASKPQQKNSGAAEPMQFGGEPASQSYARDQSRQGNASVPPIDDEPGSVLPITPRTEQEQDEQFYDTLVSAAEHNAPAPTVVEVAPTAQALTPVQVTPETADKFAAISVAIANQSKEMSTVLEAVKSVSAEIKTLKAQVDASSTKTNLFEGKLNQLTLSLNDFSKNTESRINDITKAAIAASLQAVKKEPSNKSGGNEKLVLRGGPMKSDYTSDKVNRDEKKALPKPMVLAQAPVVATPVAVKPQAQPESGNQAAKCGAKTISQVWKVKGLTYSGAYVRRDDGSALMLRADMDVPGFGRVKSFDPESRTVCTTSGLIAR